MASRNMAMIKRFLIHLLPLAIANFDPMRPPNIAEMAIGIPMLKSISPCLKKIIQAIVEENRLIILVIDATSRKLIPNNKIIV